MFPAAIKAAPFEDVGRRLAMREPFRRAALEPLAARLESDPALSSACHPKTLRGAALIEARLAEAAVADGDQQAIARRFDALDRAARLLLRCSPYEGFGWFALYWTALNQEGPTPRALDFLIQSYRVAPREAWIGMMRNNFAMQVVDLAPEETRALVLGEWSDLLHGGFFELAAGILARAPAAIQDRLMALAADLDQTKLRWLARFLQREGVDASPPTLAPDVDGRFLR